MIYLYQPIPAVHPSSGRSGSQVKERGPVHLGEDECPNFNSLTRYPCFPRRGIRSFPNRFVARARGLDQNMQLYIEFSGTDLGMLLKSLKMAISALCFIEEC